MRHGLVVHKMRSKTPIVIWGAGGHATVVTEILEICGRWSIVGYLDEVNPGRWGATFGDYPILGGEEAFQQRAGEATQEMGLECVTAIHPNAYVSPKAAIGRGVVCAAGAVVGPVTNISDGVIVNTGATIDHGCCVASYAHISPGASLGGEVAVGEGAWIGLGASVLDKRHIGEWTIIGAGAVVTRDIPAGVVAFGVPAKIQRQNTSSPNQAP